MEELIRAVLAKRKIKHVNPRIATFALLGMINWCYQWYSPDGKISINELVQGMTQIFFNGLLGKTRSV